MISNKGSELEGGLHTQSLERGSAWGFALVAAAACGFLLSVVANLVHDGKLWAIPIAIGIGLLVWILERIESKRQILGDWIPLPVLGLRSAVSIVAVLAFLVCLPSLHTYFLTDDFALLDAFHQLSAAQFLRLLHMDTRVFVSGDARQEFRPLYSLFYAWGYHVWGLRPWAYHVCEICFHALAAVLVFSTVNTLAPGNLRKAAFAGLLFAVQPPNAQATSLIVGAVAESLPAIFYLTALLSFIHFRRSGTRWFLATSAAAFLAGLLIKESAVTLPLMLLSYDLFRIVDEEGVGRIRTGKGDWKRWRGFIAPYLPYGMLLVFYLWWRRTVLSSFLRETNWASHARTEVATPAGFGTRIVHLIRHIWQLQLFNAENLLPFSVPVMGVILGILGIWVTSLLLRRKDVDRPMMLLGSFGFIWFMITNIPYLIEGQVPYHLYLPEIGICIVIACTAFPFSSNGGQKARVSRAIGMILFVVLSAVQMWKVDAQYTQLGKMSARMASQMAVSMKSVPVGGLIVLWPGSSELVSSGWGEGIVPFAIQPPFTETDLSMGKSLISHPDMTCCGDAVWWQEVEPIFEKSGGASDGEVTVSLLSWNDSTSTFDVSSRAMPKKLVSDSVTKTLGGSLESFEELDNDQAIRVVKSLVDLVQGAPSQQQN